MMMNDNNNHYSDVFGDEIKNHRRKKSKGKTRDPRTDQSSSSPSKLDWATRVLFEIQSSYMPKPTEKIAFMTEFKQNSLD